MKKRIVICIMFAVMLIGGVLAFEVQQIKHTTGTTWRVGPTRVFTTIQEAIDNESVLDGDIIEVDWKSTAYSENVTVDKTLTIRHSSYDPSGYYPTVDGVNKEGAVFNITSPNVEVGGFKIQRGWFGILLWNQSATILNNTVRWNTYGIYLDSSSNNTLKENTMTLNDWNFGVDGSNINHFMQDIDDSNTVDGKPVCYWVNQSGETVPSNAGYVAVVNSENIIVRDLQLENNVQGVLVAYSDSVVVEDLEFVDCSLTCVSLINATGSFVQDMAVLISVTTSDFVSLTNSRSNFIRNNSISSVGSGIGIDLRKSHCNSITNNSINVMGCGIYLNQCLNNTLVGNTLLENNCGMWIESGSNTSIIFHNNFLNNSWYQAKVSILCSNNKFDNEYEGNYWSDYDGEDMNEDGIGDTPYPIEVYCQDNCPLMKTWKALRAWGNESEPASYYIGMPDQKLYTFSNSTLASICLGRNLKQITLNATSGYTGFLNITIPRRWLDGPFYVFVDEVKVDTYAYTANANYSSLYFAYGKGSHSITILGAELGNLLGDLNGDGEVNLYDAVAMLTNYGRKDNVSKIYLSETE